MKEFSTCQSCSGCSLTCESGLLSSHQEICSWLGLKLPLISDCQNGWRMKAKLAVRGDAKAPLIGLFREGTHEVIDMLNCPANHFAINEAIAKVRAAIIRQQIEPYQEAKQTGVLRYVQIFVCRESGKVQLVLVAREKEAAQRLARDLWSQPNFWHSIWINIQQETTNQIFGKEWILSQGDAWLWQKMGECKAAFHPAAFAQANLQLFDRILKKLEEWVPLNARLLEVYAGVGGISLHLQSRWQSACLVEENPYAESSFQQTKAADQGLKNTRYIRADAARASEFLDEVDCVIVDPPRKGLDSQLLKAIQQSDVKTFIYISCSWKSFQRDAEKLQTAGWVIDDVALYWMFPKTKHVEIITKWKKMARPG